MGEKSYGIDNIGTWWNNNKDKLFRLLIYKKIYTPYEMDKKYSDESIYENGGYYNFVKITNIIEIPNDLLLELDQYNDEYDENDVYTYKRMGIKIYCRLSEIRLDYIDEVNN